MKRTALGFLLFALASSGFGQETEHFTVRLTPTNAPSQVVGRGDLRLTGTHLFMFVEFPTITFAVASVHGPAAPGSDGPSFIRYENLNGCGADSSDAECTSPATPTTVYSGPGTLI